jgi:putative flippase GtrA
MTTKLFPRRTVHEMQECEFGAESGQAIDKTDVAPDWSRENARKTGVDYRETLANLIAPSTLLRWCKFNLVGGIGILVQFVALFLLRGVMHFNYLFATAIAVEAAVVHNFVWHEQFTWVDRVRGAALKRCASQDPDPQAPLRRAPCGRWASSALFGPGELLGCSMLYGPSLRRFLRFNLTNGAVSILGNLALMKVMVGQGHMNYLLANGIAIALCSVANFLVSEKWVFAQE